MKAIFTSLLLFTSLGVFAQDPYYLIRFKDKLNNTYSISKPSEFLSQRAIARRTKQNIAISEHDLPLTNAYINQVITAGGVVWLKTKWFNGVVVQCNSATLTKIKALSSVLSSNLIARTTSEVSVEKLNRIKGSVNVQEASAVDPNGYSKSQLAMTENDKMHAAGYKGEGVHIAIIDAGFKNANKNPVLDSLRKKNRILGTFDVVNKQHAAVYNEDAHGANCLTILAANVPNKLKGAAPYASYWLIRTENALLESRLEEINWTVGAEFADSVGVDVISSSLGYYSFDNSALDYTYQQMNGKTTYISRAAAYAAKKGIVVVSSAGNEGALPWKYMSAPADADSILSVGAVDSLGVKGKFSSFGPSIDGRTKPEVVTRGVKTWYGDPGETNIANLGKPNSGDGTSYACPLMAGWVACFMQQFPNLNAQQVISIVKQSSNRAANPDNGGGYGYGIPKYTKAVALANVITNIDSPITINNQVNIYPNPTKSKVNIENCKSGFAIIYDLIDKVENTYLIQNNEINISNLNPGIYLLEVDNQTFKLLVE